MQYERAGLAVRIVVSGSMEGGEGNGHDDPVLITVDFIDQYDENGYHKKKQQEAPAFPDLYKDLVEVLLDEVSADDKRDDQPGDAHGDPDGGRQGRDGKNDMGDDIGPAPVPRQV